MLLPEIEQAPAGAMTLSVRPSPAPPAGVVGKLLSATGGELAAPAETQRLLAYTDHGLFVASGQQANLHVLDYVERLRRNSIQYTLHLVSIDAITAAYKSHSLGDGRRNVDMGNSIVNEQHKIISLLHEALKDDASDIHFVASTSSGCDIRFRVIGELETRHGFTYDEGMRLMSSLYNSMCDVSEKSFNPNASQRARVSAAFTEALGIYGARVQTRPTHDGLLMVLRILKADDRIITHEELGFLPAQIELMRDLASMPYGVVLISGPTGSGKSRTMQATMNMVLEADPSLHVITIENPPEYPIRGAVVTPLIVADSNDPEMVSKAWRDSVSETMRLDPDIIMVGEVSDLGSAKTCYSAAKTGHGVWSTLHANDCTSIPKRLLDLNVGADDVLDPSLTIGVTAQRLIPKLCSRCKIPLAMGRGRMRQGTYGRLLRVSAPEILTSVYVRGDGCPHCKHRGIAGRAPVVEIVKTDVAFMEIYATGGAQASLHARRHWVQKMAGITMLRHALHLVWTGVIDPQHAEDVQPLDTDLNMLGMDYAKQSQLV